MEGRFDTPGWSGEDRDREEPAPGQKPRGVPAASALPEP